MIVTDFLPKEANTTERAILIVYLLIGISNPKEIAMLLGHKYTTEVYRCLKYYQPFILKCGTGHDGLFPKIFKKI